MSVVLAQLSGVTGSTSLGSAKVMSTHCCFQVISFRPNLFRNGLTHVIERGTMLCYLDDLDCGIVPYYRCVVCWKWDLRYADTAVVCEVVWTNDSEYRLHRQRIVAWYSAVTEVNVHESVRVALEPAWLNTDGAAANGPFGAVR